MITELSEEQEIVLPKYIEKWKAIATQTKPINRDKAAATIKKAYKTINYSNPEIIFIGSPFGAIKKILATENYQLYLGRNIRNKFQKRVYDHLFHLIEKQLDKPIFYELMNKTLLKGEPNSELSVFHFPYGVESCVESQIFQDLGRIDPDYLDTQYEEVSKLIRSLFRLDWFSRSCMFDFCISELKLQYDRQKWQVIQELMQQCDFVAMFENVCFVCDRPIKLSLDSQNRLHAEWEYALQFADDYGVYAYHGMGERPEGEKCTNDQYIKPGTKVRLPSTGEYGIVAHCWYSEEIYDYDCYVAFYGTSFPDEKTDCRPYIFRYAATSLEILE
ncbi:DUF6745 domain-containing protein [Cyanothece sp. BG0011]|uniref:DUF6745 domain-containing protein n=1 Tax=Cyanothece sp. BG0011 TaxID=2082950 RepID=UPI0018E517BF|nr:hypothetical protein [Cyanothece sp. BG0011]